MNWYALHVRSCAESIVSLQLERGEVESFYPHIVEKSRDKRRDVERKFMPGYVFGRFDAENRLAVLKVPQVVSILGDAGGPIAIPDDEIEGVRAITRFPEAISCIYVPTKGDMVRVTRGGMKGLEGQVLQVKGKLRLVASLKLLQRSVSVEIPNDAVELVGHRGIPRAA